MTELDCGCTVTEVTVDGEPRERVQNCPKHAAAKEIKAALECLYSLTAQIGPGRPGALSVRTKK